MDKAKLVNRENNHRHRSEDSQYIFNFMFSIWLTSLVFHSFVSPILYFRSDSKLVHLIIKWVEKLWKHVQDRATQLHLLCGRFVHCWGWDSAKNSAFISDDQPLRFVPVRPIRSDYLLGRDYLIMLNIFRAAVHW